jgi:hypothetical protein
MSPHEGHKWFTSWLPLATAAGPFLTVGLGVVMCVSLWWMNGWLSACIDRNRAMAAQLVTQQEKFHTELLVHLQRCQPHP